MAPVKWVMWKAQGRASESALRNLGFMRWPMQRCISAWRQGDGQCRDASVLGDGEMASAEVCRCLEEGFLERRNANTCLLEELSSFAHVPQSLHLSHPSASNLLYLEY